MHQSSAFAALKHKPTTSPKARAGTAAMGRSTHTLVVNGEVWLLARDTPIDLDNAQAKRDAELRERTLTGLTAEQRRALGLSPGAPAAENS